MVSERTARRRRQRAREAIGIPPPPTSYRELTVPGNYPFHGWDSRELTRYSEVRLEELQQMIDIDGHIRGLFNILRLPILRNAKKAVIEPDGKEGEKEAEFIASNLLYPAHKGGMSVTLPKSFGHMSTAFYNGFKAFEKVWIPPNESPVDDGMIRLRKLAPRDSKTVSFLLDDRGGFDGIHVRANWRGRIVDQTLPRSRSVYYAVNEEESPYYGKPYFLPAYFHFDKKHKLYYVTHMALAVGALPPRIGRAPMSLPEADRKRVLDALSNLGANSAMFLPEGFELLDQQVEGGRGSLPYVEMLAHHNLECSKSIVAQFVDVGTGSSGGGFSLSKNHLDLLTMNLEGIQEDMCEVYNNYVIPELIDWNFGTRKFPTLHLPPFTKENRELLAEVFGKIATAREPFVSPEFLAELEKEMAGELGMELPDEASMQHQEQVEAQKRAEFELEKAMEEANRAIGGDAAQMDYRALIDDPKFIAWAESYAEEQRSKVGARSDAEDYDF